MAYILTPTGGRPKGLALLGHYLSEQTHEGPMRWLICDDVDPVSPVPPVHEGIEVEVIRPSWRWSGDNTHAQCMVELIDRVPAGAAVVIAEDDDCYLPAHVETMLEALQTAELVGQKTSYYYNVRTRRHKAIPGAFHASLGATALRGKALSMLRAICIRQKVRLDMELWRGFRGSKRLLDGMTAVGIKGIEGRQGIGVGHKDTFGNPDPHGDVLRAWVGDYAPEYRWHAR